MSIYFIARGAHLAEIRKHGLILNTKEQNGLVCRPTAATDDVSSILAPDLCLLCVKSYDLEGAVRDLKKVMLTDTIIVPLLNGVDVCDRIRAVTDDGVVLPACVYVETHIEQPGTVTQKGGEGVIRLGPDPRYPGYDASQLVETLGRLGVKAKWNPDPYPDIWEKFIFIAGFGLVTASTGKTIGEVAADPALRETVAGIMAEIGAIADKKGIALPGDVVGRSLAKAGNFSFVAKTSYQRDVETKGRRNEGDLFGATIIRMGREYGVPTPVTEEVYNVIQKD